MICEKCGKDLTNAVKILGRDIVITIHERAHEYLDLVDSLRSVQSLICHSLTIENGRERLATIIESMEK